MDICPKCGLPREACVCESIAKAEHKIRVSVVKRRYGKLTTLITGFDPSINLKEIAKKLKSKLACGGTVKNEVIELQGNHVDKVLSLLSELGFTSERVE